MKTATKPLSEIFADQRLLLSAVKSPAATMKVAVDAPAGAVPAVDPEYVWNRKTCSIAMDIASGLLSKNWLLGGLPGAGKTEFIFQFCARTGRPLVVVDCPAYSEPGPLFSSVEPDDKSKSGLRRIDGPVIRAYRMGGVLALDEVTAFAPELQLLLHAVLDRRPLLVPGSGETVNPHPDLVIIATTNDAHGEDRMRYRGNYGLNAALESRFAQIKFEPDQELIIAALQARVPSIKLEYIEHMLDLARSVQNSSAGLREFSFRQMVTAAKYLALKPSATFEDAIDVAYLSLKPASDRAAVQELIKSIKLLHSSGKAK